MSTPDTGMRYFDKYSGLIDSGEIPACRELLLAIKRVRRFKREYIFKQREADKRIAFIERECCNTKGVSSKLKLALPQKAWLETVWGFYREAEVTKTDPETMREYKATEERRLIHEVPIIVARGSGKTTLASAVALVGQIADGEYGADVQCLAPVRKQSGYLFDASRAMTSFEGTLLHKLKLAGRLASTKYGLLYRDTNSLFSISTSDYDTLDGSNCHYNIFDEVHQYREDFIKVVNDGSNLKRKDWVTWYVTTNGTVRGMVFDRYYASWIDILEGKTDNDTVMPFIYKLDDVSEVAKPETWVKAMPLLGVTSEKEAVARDIEKSKGDPVLQAELLTKTFNLPVNAFLAYFTNEECQGNRKKFKPALFVGDEERAARAVLGVDLSDVNDICCVSFMVAQGDKRYFLTKKYAPRSRVDKLPKEQRDQYLKWESKGELHIHELDHNDQRYVFDDLLAFIRENKILPVKVGFDKWNAREITRLFEDYYGGVAYEVPQTVKGLSTGLKMYKSKLGAGNLIFDDDFVSWNHGNVNVKTDANNNVFPNKAQAKAKIDGFAAQLNAFICYEDNREELEIYF